jgi:hypothetical protein
MKRIVLLALTVVLVALPLRAEAHHRPTSYCSSTGDICQSTTKVNGIRRLRISLFAKYFDRYRLCVRAPDGTRECHVFEIRAQGSNFGSSVRWGLNFPHKGPGPYTVSWWTGGSLVGRVLGFHKRAAA